MEFPKRSEHHIKETSGKRLLQNSIPDHWVIREATERDYGVDAYIEFVTADGNVTGDICFIQLKTTSHIDWDEDQAKFKGLNKSTINYWMNMPVPVFLAVADLSADEVYFSPVKDMVRRNYDKYKNTKKTMSLPLRKDWIFTSEMGLAAFIAFYLYEKSFTKISEHFRMLIIHAKENYEFIVINQGRDHFLPVDDKRIIMVKHIVELCNFMAGVFLIQLDSEELHKKIVAYEKSFDDGYDFHEATLTEILRFFEPVFIAVLEKSKKQVTVIHKQFWMAYNRSIYSMYKNLDIQAVKKLDFEDF
jgi:hypothetical protein